MKFEHIFLELNNKIKEIDGFELNSHNVIKLLRITIEIVEVVNLKEVWDEKILKSLNSMSESILEYKQLTKIKDYLNSFII